MDRDGSQLADLVARARAGDVGAFESLYRSHQAGIYSFVRSQVRQDELAADLTQQTFVRAWQSLPRLRKEGAFRGWLHQIAANLVRDEMKSVRARVEVTAAELPEALVSGEDPGPEESVVRHELRAAVWAALDALSGDQRAAVVMHHMEGMSVTEIAHAVGVRPGTIMSRLARAREALRRSLTPYLEDSDAGL